MPETEACSLPTAVPFVGAPSGQADAIWSGRYSLVGPALSGQAGTIWSGRCYLYTCGRMVYFSCVRQCFTVYSEGIN